METTEIIKSLEKLAEKLGTTAEKIFSYYVKDAKLFRIYYLLELLFSVVIFISGILLIINFVPENNYWNAINITFFSLGIAALISGFIYTIVILSSIGNFLNSFFNPEYIAIESILSKLTE